MPNYKLLALDLDGTTLTDDKRISEETKMWINRAVEAGVTVIFATGRGIQTTIEYWRELDLKSPMVLVNGAEIWKGPGQVLERHFLRKEDVRWLHTQAERAGVRYWGYSVESFTNSLNWTDKQFNENWMKFAMATEDGEKIVNLRQLIKARGTLEITNSESSIIELSVRGVSKESGVRTVCELLGIKMEHVMAIGDGLNDYKLIQAAGLGVAMGNGMDQLKEIADVITDTNEENGVAKAIEHYLLGARVPVSR